MGKSNTVRNVVIALLTLWLVISVIIIVVWAHTPYPKDVGQCHAELQRMRATLEEKTAAFDQNKVALENMVLEGRDNQTRQRGEIDRLLMELDNATASLDVCRRENVILNGNITDLEKQIDMHKDIEANLTSEITLRQDHIEALQQNLTQASHQREYCQALQSAAESRKMAAESQTKACESSKLFLQKQLQKCKKEDPPTVAEQVDALDNGCTTPKISLLALAGVLCTTLHLITCK